MRDAAAPSAATVGILGGGQLARMLALAAAPLGLRCRVLDPDPAPPAGIAADVVCGAYDDAGALDRLADGAAVVTYEFENVPVASAHRLAARVPVHPAPGALEVAQDRLAEKTFFRRVGIDTTPFAPVGSRTELDAAVASLGLPAVLKTRRLGYDGKGQVVLRTAADVAPAWETLRNGALVLEAFVPFQRELAVLAVRGRDGGTAYWPLVETHHRDGVLRRAVAPAPGLDAALQHAAEDLARRLLDGLGYVGVLSLELFQVDGRLLANEMAPRVHNSGHWTIEGAETSQFENHLRAVTGLPLGPTTMRGHAVMLNVVGAAPEPAAVLAVPGAHLHLYGKAPRARRKLGHVTLRADTAADAEAAAARIAPLLADG
jgi:5-(carboxyamino)imidazole ribonucleotide synthase